MFGSSSEAPEGYITMLAGDILAAASALLADREAKQKAWDEAMPGKVVAWAKSLHWFWRSWHSAPTDPAKAKKWYYDFEWPHQRPDITDLDDRPHTPGTAVDWKRRAKCLAPDTKVFINIDEGSALTTWIPKKEAS